MPIIYNNYYVAHITCVQDGGLFKDYEACQLMTVGKEIKLDGTKWKHVFIQCKSNCSVTPGSLFLYYNPQLGSHKEHYNYV